MQTSVQDFLNSIGLRVSRYSDATNEYNLRCPFHTDNTPSLFINLDKGMVKCFGSCDFGGSLYNFLRKYDQPNSKGYLYQLESISALNLTEWMNNDYVKKEPKVHEPIDYTVLELCSPDLPYLTERHITIETIEKFEIHYDKRLQSIVFPVYNEEKEDIGYIKRNLFGSRKYLNSPYMKTDEMLFPIDKLEENTDSIILVEGAFDAIRAHQEGYTNTLSHLGGVLSDKHMAIISNHTNYAVVCFDKDDEGIKIGKRNIQQLHKFGFVVDVAVAPGASKDLAGAYSLEDLKIEPYQKLMFAGKDIESLVTSR